MEKLKRVVIHLEHEFEKSEKVLESFVSSISTRMEECMFTCWSTKKTLPVLLDGVRIRPASSIHDMYHTMSVEQMTSAIMSIEHMTLGAMNRGLQQVAHAGHGMVGDEHHGGIVPPPPTFQEEDAEEARGLQTIRLKERALSQEVFMGYSFTFSKCVEITMMLNCVWLSLWATNYTAAATVTANPAFWQGLMIVPVLCTLPLVLGVVRSCAKLNAFVHLDHESLASVIDIMEDVQEMRQSICGKLNSRLNQLNANSEERDEFVRKLVDSIDLDKSGELQFVEFRKLVRMFGISSSKIKLQMLFDSFDESKDGTISAEELLHFLKSSYPSTETDEAKCESNLVRDALERQSLGRQSIRDSADDLAV